MEAHKYEKSPCDHSIRLIARKVRLEMRQTTTPGDLAGPHAIDNAHDV
ncbi:MAG: hypothetical protein JXA93_13915 [Anaerolineae bacterium]|nr:hypothetical protein [Anaerolineae bacterium]